MAEGRDVLAALRDNICIKHVCKYCPKSNVFGILRRPMCLLQTICDHLNMRTAKLHQNKPIYNHFAYLKNQTNPHIDRRSNYVNINQYLTNKNGN